MKFLFKLIVLPILSIVALPLIFLALAYKSVEIPVEDFEGVSGDFTLTAMVQEEMDTFLTSNTVDSEVGIGFSQQQANALIKGIFLGMNPGYLDENEEDTVKNYVLYDEMMGVTYGYQGTWVRFKEDIVEIESGLHLKYSALDFTYKTRVLITFKLTANTDEIILKLEKFTVGNIPLAWVFSAASWAAEQATGQDLEALISGLVDGFATFDPQEREIKVDIQELVASQFQEDPNTGALVSALLGFVKENELVDIGFEDEVFSGSIALGKLKDDSAPFQLTALEKITDESQLQSIFAAKASALIFSTLSTTTDPFIELDAFTLNRILEYMLRANLQPSGALIESNLTDEISLTALAPYAEMGESFVIAIPIIIQDINDPLKKFQTIIKLEAEPAISGNDLVIALNSLSAGLVTLGEEYIDGILTLIGDNDMIVDGQFVIQNFNDQLAQAGMTLSQVAMVNGNLRLYVQLDDSIPLAEITQAVQDVLDIVQNDPNLTPEVQDAISDVIDSLTNPEVDTEEAIEALLAEMENLDDAEQEALYTSLLDALSGLEEEYADLFDLIPQP
jgi:hypothetical protein